MSEKPDTTDSSQTKAERATAAQDASEALHKDVLDSKVFVPTPAEQQRRAQETSEFRDRLEKQNVELKTDHKGWGPYQILQDMVQKKEIELTDEQILSEARRIRDRDFSAMGRPYYKSTDHSKLWSNNEEDQRLEAVLDRVKGIDVSKFQGVVDWHKVKEAGYEFAFLKASEGNTIVDAQLANNKRGAEAEGLKVGYYHFFRPNDSVDKQVKNFLKAIGDSAPDSLRLVVDLEIPKIWKHYTAKQRVDMVDNWCKEVEKATGITPEVTVYGSGKFFTDTLQSSKKLGSHELWLANYNAGEPSTPKPWDQWTFWQYTKKGKVDGIKGNVDIDVYNGTVLPEKPKS